MMSLSVSSRLCFFLILLFLSQSSMQPQQQQQQQQQHRVYGFPSSLSPWGIDTSTAAFNPLPLPISGNCTKDKQYEVNSIADLFALIPEIECVWTQAVVPNKVPLGAAYGRLLTFANTAFVNYFVEFVYQGDYLLQTQCNGNYYNIGVLNFGGLDLSTGIWTISPLPDHFTFVEGEQYDGRAGVLMDFTTNVPDFCPFEGNEKVWSFLLQGFSPFNRSRWPYRLFIDMLRAVGRDTDGCVILLGRTWMINPLPSKSPLATVLYFTLKTCDEKVLPDFKRGTPLDPIPHDFKYHRRGVFEFLKRLNPISYFLSDHIFGNYPNGLYDYSTYIDNSIDKQMKEGYEYDDDQMAYYENPSISEKLRKFFLGSDERK